MHVIRWTGFGIVILAGTLSLSAQPAPVIHTPGVMASARINPSLVTVRPDALGIIQGNALDSTNGQLANATVRLRDARYGRVIGSQLTDQTGLFTFRHL